MTRSFSHVTHRVIPQFYRAVLNRLVFLQPDVTVSPQSEKLLYYGYSDYFNVL